MTLRKNKFPSATRCQDSRHKSKSSGTELLAYAGTVITALSTLAWTAGYSYNVGYWDKADLPNSYIVNSVQETMFSGIQAVNSWMYLLISLIGCGLLVFFGSLRPNKPKTLAKSRKTPKWRLDESMSWFGISMAGAGDALMIGILIFALWFWSAAREGEVAYSKLVCAVKANDEVPNSLLLADGSLLHGRVINRSDNITLLLNKKGLHVVSLKNAPVVIEIVPLPDVSCKSSSKPASSDGARG